jgi:hypothetical protein
LKNGDRMFGYVDRYSTSENVKEADLYLVGPGLTWIRAPEKGSPGSGKTVRLDEWDGLYVRANEISWLRLAYKPTE